MEDIYGIESGVTPMKSNFTPINYANVPYFILVGYELMEEEDFDFNLGFWLSDPQDNNNGTVGARKSPRIIH